MSLALDTMVTAKNHITQDVEENEKVAGAYPLTMVIYAMVPTGGISKKKAAKIAEFLDFVANEGQVQGTAPGELPSGYLPLTSTMRAETLKAAREMLHQTGNSTAKRTSAPVPTATPTPRPGTVSLGYVTNPESSGLARYALPILLITGGLLAVAGSFTLTTGRGGAVVLGALRKARLPQVRLPRGKKP